MTPEYCKSRHKFDDGEAKQSGAIGRKPALLQSATPASNALILGSAGGLTPSTRKGSDYAKRAAVTAAPSR